MLNETLENVMQMSEESLKAYALHKATAAQKPIIEEYLGYGWKIIKTSEVGPAMRVVMATSAGGGTIVAIYPNGFADQSRPGSKSQPVRAELMVVA